MNTASPTTVCEHCGTGIDTTDWYPVETEITGDGNLRFHSFCSEGCRSAWNQ